MIRAIFLVGFFTVFTSTANACASGRLESFDWAQPNYAPKELSSKFEYISGEVVRIFGRTNLTDDGKASFGDAVIKKDNGDELQVRFSGTSCGGKIRLGQIALFAIGDKKTFGLKNEVSNIRYLKSYTHHF